MIIYIDNLFFQNTIVLFIVLFLFSKVMNIRIAIAKLLIITIAENIFEILILILSPRLYLSPLFQNVLIFLVLFFGFNIRNLKKIIIYQVILCAAIDCLGGIGMRNNNIFLSIIIFALVGIIIIYIKNIREKRYLIESTTCQIEFKSKDKNYKFNALVDTGNNVKTIYNEAVIFVSSKYFKIREEERKRKISYKTISENGILYGNKINDIYISYAGKEILADAVIVPINNVSDEYDAIVSFDLIKGGISKWKSCY